MRTQRHQQRIRRMRRGIPQIALVGYTNAGKSTLLNALAGSSAYVADKLFATLDPTTRRVVLGDGRTILFTDTVGFIQKLPHQLIAAFRGTLEEVVYADLLVHVVDLSHPQAAQQIEIVDAFLKSLLPEPGPAIIMAMNKVDLVKVNEESIKALMASYPNGVPISAATGVGLNHLLERVQAATEEDIRRIVIRVPFQHFDVVARFYGVAGEVSQSDYEDGVELCGSVRVSELRRFESFLVG